MSIESIVASGRRLIETTFLDTGVISDRELVRDTKGGTKQTWTPRGSATVCRFVALTDDLPQIEGGTAFGVPTAVWLAPLGTDAQEGDKVARILELRRPALHAPEEAAPHALEEVQRVKPRPKQPRKLPPHDQADLGFIAGQEFARSILIPGGDAREELRDVALVAVPGRIVNRHVRLPLL